ncbi:TIGR04282 family arsenosugar biosynthesis glycosyltransferase [Chondrinema litorale]|uniref:TIGR04282 family arsenosugar biosynthesis glycosyltransferase n=1 Tax=Chondrinema litorale TaxID=2994555 RepID=UPI0025446678|nr:TIGR04282 family arsenosugar biosynthesis glycosyltransferase [Chondrinema litorale]UZR94379.1 TIGR04282 family arsenosugar biosynthesis glycosyltransferase [Chondrinema litorale]
MYQHEVLIIFTKNPALGKVKTRLAKTIGDQKALAVYNQLLQLTQKTTATLPYLKIVYYDNFVDENDIWLNNSYSKKLQKKGSLGEKMYDAIDTAFNNKASKVVIIGSDCPEISPKIIIEAFNSLNKFDTVIGPANDGGYYLLGMSKFIPDVFKNKNWSTSTVKHDTISDLKNLNKSIHFLPELTDIDKEADYEKLKKLLN